LFRVFSGQEQERKREMIENEFHFNTLVDNIQPNDKKERIINDLRVQIRGQKAYGDWKI